MGLGTGLNFVLRIFNRDIFRIRTGCTAQLWPGRCILFKFNSAHSVQCAVYKLLSHQSSTTVTETLNTKRNTPERNLPYWDLKATVSGLT